MAKEILKDEILTEEQLENVAGGHTRRTFLRYQIPPRTRTYA